MNPLIPAAYDIVWTVVSALMMAMLVIALVSLSRSAKRLTATNALIWALLVIFVPIVGPIAWLALGNRSGLAREETSSGT